MGGGAISKLSHTDLRVDAASKIADADNKIAETARVAADKDRVAADKAEKDKWCKQIVAALKPNVVCTTNDIEKIIPAKDDLVTFLECIPKKNNNTLSVIQVFENATKYNMMTNEFTQGSAEVRENLKKDSAKYLVAATAVLERPLRMAIAISEKPVHIANELHKNMMEKERNDLLKKNYEKYINKITRYKADYIMLAAILPIAGKTISDKIKKHTDALDKFTPTNDIVKIATDYQTYTNGITIREFKTYSEDSKKQYTINEKINTLVCIRRVADMYLKYAKKHKKYANIVSSGSVVGDKIKTDPRDKLKTKINSNATAATNYIQADGSVITDTDNKLYKLILLIHPHDPPTNTNYYNNDAAKNYVDFTNTLTINDFNCTWFGMRYIINDSKDNRLCVIRIFALKHQEYVRKLVKLELELELELELNRQRPIKTAIAITGRPAHDVRIKRAAEIALLAAEELDRQRPIKTAVAITERPAHDARIKRAAEIALLAAAELDRQQHIKTAVAITERPAHDARMEQSRLVAEELDRQQHIKTAVAIAEKAAEEQQMVAKERRRKAAEEKELEHQRPIKMAIAIAEKAEQDRQLRAAEELRLKTAEELRLKAVAEEELRLKTEEELRLKTEDELRLKAVAEEELRLKAVAEEELRLKTEEELRLKAVAEEAKKKQTQRDIIRAIPDAGCLQACTNNRFNQFVITTFAGARHVAQTTIPDAVYDSRIDVDDNSRNIIRYIIKSNDLDNIITDKDGVFRRILTAAGTVCAHMPLVRTILCRYDVDNTGTSPVLTTERIAAQQIYNILADIHTESMRGQKVAKYTRTILDTIVCITLLVILCVSISTLPVNYYIIIATCLFIVANIVHRLAVSKIWRPDGAKKFSLLVKSVTNTNDILQTCVWPAFATYTGAVPARERMLIEHITNLYGRPELFKKIIATAVTVSSVILLLKSQPAESGRAIMQMYRYIIYTLYRVFAPGEIYTDRTVHVECGGWRNHHSQHEDMSVISNGTAPSTIKNIIYTTICIACLALLLVSMIMPAPDDARIPLFYIMVIYGFVRAIIFITLKCKAASRHGILSPGDMLKKYNAKIDDLKKTMTL